MNLLVEPASRSDSSERTLRTSWCAVRSPQMPSILSLALKMASLGSGIRLWRIWCRTSPTSAACLILFLTASGILDTTCLHSAASANSSPSSSMSTREPNSSYRPSFSLVQVSNWARRELTCGSKLARKKTIGWPSKRTR